VGRSGSMDIEARKTLTTVLGSVINARANRYLLCNVAKDRLAEVTSLLPTTGSPTVMDLADAGCRCGARARSRRGHLVAAAQA